MGLIRDTWRGFWQSRAARYQSDALREQAEARKQQRRLDLARKPIKSAAELLESAILETETAFGWDRTTIWKEALDPYLDFARGGLGIGGAGVTDHTGKRGADFPFFASEAELAMRRDTSRMVVGTNDNAMGLLGGLRRYTIGNGASVRVVAKQNQPDDQFVDAAQQIVDEFIRLNRFGRKQREFFTRTSRDGEAFLRLFPQVDGSTAMRFVWPEQVRQPVGTDAEEWSYGRQTDPDDVETTLAWAVFPTKTSDNLQPEILNADEIIYFGPNADSGVKRSLPDFCLATGDVLEAAGKLATNMGEGSAQQAAIAYIRQHESPVSSIRDFASADASYTKPDLYGGSDIKVKKAIPGTIVDTNKNTTFLASPYNAGISSHLEVFQMLVRRAHARWNAPEWLGSSYSQQVNFASSLTAESPFILTVLEMQAYYAEVFEDLFTRIIAIAAASERLPKNILDQIEIKVTFPNPQARDRMQEAQRGQILLSAGVVSPQQIAEEQGYEWGKIVKERQEAQADGWQGGGQSQSQQTQLGTGTDDITSQDESDTGDNGPMDSDYDITESLYESGGFTGVKVDSLNRKMYYRDGKHIASPTEAEKKQIESVGKGSPQQSPGKKLKVSDRARQIVGKLKSSKERAFAGDPTGGKISKQLAGAIGEEIVIQYLRSIGYPEAGQLNEFLGTKKNNLPVDLIHDHKVVEVKTGQSSNSNEAQQWRLTIGEPGKKEKEWIKTATQEQKAKLNAKKQAEIHRRKKEVIANLEKKLGHTVSGMTITVIVNTDTNTADIYQFDGFHDRIAWKSELAQKGYIKSVKYG